MKRNKRNRSCNFGCSRVENASNKNSRASSTANFAKNKSIITDNEYEVTSETNRSETNKSETNSMNNRKRKRSK